MKRLLAFAIIGMMSAPAIAADLGGQGGYKDDLSSVVGPCSGVSWTGLRIGGLVGVGMTGIGSGDGTVSEPDSKPRDFNTSSASQLSTVGQVEIGADYQFKNSPVVIGAFGNFGYGSGAAEVTYSGNVRAGLAAGNALFYAFGGYEKSHLAHEVTDINTGSLITTMKADPDALVYGVGVDIALGHWYVGLRAERADYGTFTAKGSNNGVSYVVDTSGTDDRGLVTLGYKF
jgi:hypothetical protein